MNEKMCPVHKIPMSTPTYKGTRECPRCLEKVQERLIKYMERQK